MKKKLTPAQSKHNKFLNEVCRIVQNSRRAEDPMSYGDGDGEGWGPAMGCAARAGAEHNARIPDLMKFLRGLKK